MLAGGFFKTEPPGEPWPISEFAWFRVHIWYASGSSHMSTHSSQPRWISRKTPVGSRHHLASRRFDLRGAFLHMSSWGGLVTKIEKCVVCAGPSLLLNCPAILVLEFSSTGSDSPIALSWWWEGSTSCLSITIFLVSLICFCF